MFKNWKPDWKGRGKKNLLLKSANCHLPHAFLIEVLPAFKKVGVQLSRLPHLPAKRSN